MSGLNKILAAMAALLALVHTYLMCCVGVIHRTYIRDFFQFYTAAKMVVEGHPALAYNVQAMCAKQHELSKALPSDLTFLFFLPPFGLLLLSPVALLPLEQASLIWQFFLLACLIASLIVLKLAFKLSATATLWLTAYALISGPAVWDLLLGQLAPVILLTFSTAILCLKRNHPIWASMALSLLLIKPHEFFPLLLFMAGAGYFRLLIMVALMSVPLIVVPLLAFGPSVYTALIALLRYDLAYKAASQPRYLTLQWNPTWHGQLLSIWGNSDLVLLASILAAVIMSVLCVCFGRFMATSRFWLEAALLVVMPAALAFCLHLHDYDLLLLLPGVACLLSADLRPLVGRRLVILGALAGGLLSWPVLMFVHHLVINCRWPNPYFQLLVALLVAGLAFVWRNRGFFLATDGLKTRGLTAE